MSHEVLRTTCLFCGSAGEPMPVRGMPLRRCRSCGFLWMEKEILNTDYYEHEWEANASPEKVLSRYRNGLERVRIIQKYITSLDHTCDIGTGEGLMVQIFKDQGYAECLGIEPSQEAVTAAKKSGLDVVQGTVHDFAQIAKEHSVQNATMFHVIEHLTDPLESVQLIYDALPTGGSLVIETPNFNGYSGRMLGTDWRLVYPEHLSYFDQNTLDQLVTKAGFMTVARGKRDFDVSHMSIGESLFRLGLRKKNVSRSSGECALSAKKIPDSISGKHVLSAAQAKKFASPLSPVAQPVLTSLVRLLGRLDYIWIIAHKE